MICFLKSGLPFHLVLSNFFLIFQLIGRTSLFYCSIENEKLTFNENEFTAHLSEVNVTEAAHPENEGIGQIALCVFLSCWLLFFIRKFFQGAILRFLGKNQLK